MQFPNELQSAIMFDQRITSLDQMVDAFTKMEEARSGARFNMIEAKPGISIVSSAAATS